jgi:hypothetical protein
VGNTGITPVQVLPQGRYYLSICRTLEGSSGMSGTYVFASQPVETIHGRMENLTKLYRLYGQMQG